MYMHETAYGALLKLQSNVYMRISKCSYTSGVQQSSSHSLGSSFDGGIEELANISDLLCS